MSGCYSLPASELTCSDACCVSSWPRLSCNCISSPQLRLHPSHSVKMRFSAVSWHLHCREVAQHVGKRDSYLVDHHPLVFLLDLRIFLINTIFFIHVSCQANFFSVVKKVSRSPSRTILSLSTLSSHGLINTNLASELTNSRSV